jgi:hypothetical protein
VVASGQLVGFGETEVKQFANALLGWAAEAAEAVRVVGGAAGGATDATPHSVVTSRSMLTLQVSQSVDLSNDASLAALSAATELAVCMQTISCSVTLLDFAVGSAATSSGTSSGRMLAQGGASTPSIVTYDVSRTRTADVAAEDVALEAALRDRLLLGPLASRRNDVSLMAIEMSHLGANVTVTAHGDSLSPAAQLDAQTAVVEALSDVASLNAALAQNSVPLPEGTIGLSEPEVTHASHLAPAPSSSQDKGLLDALGLGGAVAIGVGLLAICMVFLYGAVALIRNRQQRDIGAGAAAASAASSDPKPVKGQLKGQKASITLVTSGGHHETITAAQPPPPPDLVSSAADGRDDQSPWEPVHTDDGDVYYHNVLTGEASWTPDGEKAIASAFV